MGTCSGVSHVSIYEDAPVTSKGVRDFFWGYILGARNSALRFGDGVTDIGEGSLD